MEYDDSSESSDSDRESSNLAEICPRRDGAVAIVCLDLISGRQECFHGYTTWKAKVCTVSGVKPTL